MVGHDLAHRGTCTLTFGRVASVAKVLFIGPVTGDRHPFFMAELVHAAYWLGPSAIVAGVITPTSPLRCAPYSYARASRR